MMTPADFAVQAAAAIGVAVLMTVPGPALDQYDEHKRLTQSRHRFELAAAKICGKRAWRETDTPGEIVCVGKK